MKGEKRWFEVFQSLHLGWGGGGQAGGDGGGVPRFLVEIVKGRDVLSCSLCLSLIDAFASMSRRRANHNPKLEPNERHA